VNVRQYGAAAVLVEPDDPTAVLGLAATLRDHPDVVEVVPGARTLLVRATPASIAAIGERVRSLAAAGATRLPDRPGDEIVLDVHYDGPDLAGTAARLGLDADGLVRRHSAGRYVVAFCGFAPGFAYLTGLDAELHVPRLSEPRTRVPAGAVGIAGEFTGVYPRPSPGGWRLLGHTDAPLWDLERTPPALLTPGTRVRFRAR
jgi:KipI family sensor histidine kinase inhibitor